MRATFAIATLFAGLMSLAGPTATTAQAENDLFSEISMAAVFDDATAPAAETVPAKKPKRSINMQSLLNPTSVEPKRKPTTDSKPTAKAKPAAKAEPAAKTKPPTTSAPKLSLVGTWSAAINDSEALAIEIAANRQFRLVHIKNGKTLVSNGTASKSGAELTLSEDEKAKLIGTVSQQDNQAFSFAIKGDDGAVALTLNFKKSP